MGRSRALSRSGGARRRRSRSRAGGLKLYVRVFERDGGYRSVLNKTYNVNDYVSYVGMLADVRRALWSVYVKKLKGVGSGPKPVRFVS